MPNRILTKPEVTQFLAEFDRAWANNIVKAHAQLTEWRRQGVSDEEIEERIDTIINAMRHESGRRTSGPGPSSGETV